MYYIFEFKSNNKILFVRNQKSVIKSLRVIHISIFKDHKVFEDLKVLELKAERISNKDIKCDVINHQIINFLLK